MNTKLLLLLSFVFSVGCASKKISDVVITPPPAPVPEVPESLEPVIDYPRLQEHLGMKRRLDSLGFLEKSFDTCQVGYGYSSNKNCRKDFFVLIHFQLMCRDADESQVAFNSSTMRPLNGRTVNWSLKGANGTLNLDDNGYGQIRTTFRNSQRFQRLRINIDNEVLYIRAGEMNRIVTPPAWCR